MSFTISAVAMCEQHALHGAPTQKPGVFKYYRNANNTHSMAAETKRRACKRKGVASSSVRRT